MGTTSLYFRKNDLKLLSSPFLHNTYIFNTYIFYFTLNIKIIIIMIKKNQYSLFISFRNKSVIGQNLICCSSEIYIYFHFNIFVLYQLNHMRI